MRLALKPSFAEVATQKAKYPTCVYFSLARKCVVQAKVLNPSQSYGLKSEFGCSVQAHFTPPVEQIPDGMELMDSKVNPLEFRRNDFGKPMPLSKPYPFLRPDKEEGFALLGHSTLLQFLNPLIKDSVADEGFTSRLPFWPRHSIG